MAKFRSVNDEVRYYPTLGVEVAPNEIVELPADTNAQGLILDNKKPVAEIAPAVDASPVE